MTVDAFVFFVSAAVILVGGIGVIAARNPVHSALMLVMTLFGVAVLFVAQEAHFLAAVQVIVYAGAIVVLFLFVIMLLGVDRSEDITTEPITGQRPLAAALGVALFGMLTAVIVATVDGSTGRVKTEGESGSIDPSQPDVEQLGESIFTDWVFAFEITAALLTIAVVGAIALARRPDGELQAIPAPEPIRPRTAAADDDRAGDEEDESDEVVAASGEGEAG